MDCLLALIVVSILFYCLRVPQATKKLLAIKKILRIAGKWIAKIRKPFAPKSFANLDNFLIIKWQLFVPRKNKIARNFY
jgi:hypothetical protein